LGGAPPPPPNPHIPTTVKMKELIEGLFRQVLISVILTFKVCPKMSPRI
jgi:hypothetical protein